MIKKNTNKIEIYHVNNSAPFFAAYFFFDYQGEKKSGTLVFDYKRGYEVILPKGLQIEKSEGAAICKNAVVAYKEYEKKYGL